MKITIEITPTEDDGGNEMVEFTITQENGEDESMAVLRATARMMRAILWEHRAIHSESEFIKDKLGITDPDDAR